MTKKFKLPPVSLQDNKKIKTLPFNGKAVSEKGFSFSFACFDRTHELFNLGDNTENGVVNSKWFLELLDCLKSVSNKTTAELKASLHDLHPVDWSNANASIPDSGEQCEYWQFRINKSKGRVIGFLIEGVFYVVWLDPHHNLTDSEGYGKATKYRAPISLYENQEVEIQSLKERIAYLEEDNNTYRKLFEEFDGINSTTK